MLLEWIRLLRGYVWIEFSGRFPERFINVTSRAGIRLWRVERHADGFTAAMYRSDWRRIRPLARAAGVKLKLLKKRGLPSFVFRWRDRVGIALGAFVFLLTVFVMSQFIWSIDVTGLETLSESEVRSLLRAHGLYVGAFTPAVDSHAVSRAVMLDNGRIGWMAVNITGSYASVEIKEEATPPQLYDAREPVNIKARRDGTILRIEAGEGAVLLKEGSGVAAGQLVVSGVMEDKLGGTRLVRANARVIAATSYGAQFRVPACPELLLPDGEGGERRTLCLYGLCIPLAGYAAESEEYACAARSDALRLMDTDLPVGVVTERFTGWERKQMTLDDNSAKELLMKEARLYEAFTLSRCTVTDRRYSLTRDEAGYRLSVVYSCVEDIAEPSVIGTDEGTDLVRIPSVGKDE